MYLFPEVFNARGCRFCGFRHCIAPAVAQGCVSSVRRVIGGDLVAQDQADMGVRPDIDKPRWQKRGRLLRSACLVNLGTTFDGIQGRLTIGVVDPRDIPSFPWKEMVVCCKHCESEKYGNGRKRDCVLVLAARRPCFGIYYNI